MGFLKNPKFDIMPLLEAIEEVILPLRKTMEWGYNIPYMLSGMLNIHPDTAMKYLALPDGHPDKGNFVKFYSKLADEAT